jgi:hypothetical protein
MPIFLLLTHFLLIPGLALRPAPAQATPTEYFVPAFKTLDAGRILGPPAASGESYANSPAPEQNTPVIPLLPWGLFCDQDWLVSLSGDPGWGMIEIIRVQIPSKAPVWFTLDSKLDGTQFVGLPSHLPEARELASLFPAPNYDSDLTVQESGPESDRTLKVRYRRMDGALIAFSIRASTLAAPRSLRNGNGMNHSERTALAIIDLESFRMAAARVVFEKDPAHPEIHRAPQRIAGVPIAGLLVQTVGGFMKGAWTQAETQVTPDRKRGSRGASPRTFHWNLSPDGNSGQLTEAGPFQNTTFHYDIYHSPERAGRDYFELRSIEISQKTEASATDRETLRAEFNPALPDFRYRLFRRQAQSNWTLSLAGQPAYAHGTLSLSPGDQPEQGDIRIKMISTRPQWTRERPLLAQIKPPNGGAFRTESLILAPGIPNESQSTTHGRSIGTTLSALQSFDFAWELRPHRLSSLIVRLPGTLSEADPGEFQLGGGTWANGESASDRALSAISRAKVSGLPVRPSRFYLASTPLFPLVQQARQASKKAEVEGIHKLEIQLPPVTPGMRRFAVLHGFEFKAGPLHESTGLTLSGLGLEIQDQIETRSGLMLRIQMHQAFRAVPDRLQDFENYSGLGRVHVAILEAPDTSAGEDRQFTARRTEPRQFFPDGEGLVARCTLESERPLIPTFLTRFAFAIEDEHYFGGRYIRKLRASALPTEFTERFSNAGEIARETPWHLEKTVSTIPDLAWESQSPLECLNRP